MAVFLLLAVFPATALSQEPTGSLIGYVRNASTQQPIEGAVVDLEGTPFSAVTDRSGRFSWSGVPTGVYRVRGRAIGFSPLVRPAVPLGSGRAADVVLLLEPAPITLGAINVEPSYFAPSRVSGDGAQTLTADETRRAPGVQEDVVRAVALLPGVGVTTGGRNDLIVRGGAPFENLFLVDGLEVPNINHFGSQGSTGGPLSLINIDFVESAEFATGGIGPRYGNRTASVTDIRLRDPLDDRMSGEINLSATGFGAFVEGPLSSTTSYWLGVRRSYLDLLFKAAGFSFVPAYWDMTLKTTTRVSRSSTLKVLAIGALNSVEFFNENAEDRVDNSQILGPEQRQYFAAVSWQQFFDDAVLNVTLGRTFVRFESVQRDSANPPQPVFENFSREGENSLRFDLVWTPTDRVEITAGNISRLATALEYDVTLSGDLRRDDLGTARPLGVDTSFTAFSNASYASLKYRLSPSVSLTGGVRVNHYGFIGATRAAPRFTLDFLPVPGTRFWIHGGRYHQPPSYIWLLGDPTNETALQPIRADQLVLGFSRDVRPDTRLQLEAFYKDYGSYPARLWRPRAVLAPTGFEDATTDIPFGLEPLASVGQGRTYGVELLLRKRLSDIPLFGLASVALTRAEFAGLDGVTRSGAYDGRVIANFLLGYRPNRSWEISGKFRFATGLPTTPFSTSGPNLGRLDFSRYNEGARLPAFHALDIRIDRRWSFSGLQLETYIDVQNVYGRTNVSARRWDPRLGAPEADEALGVLPSIGVNIEF